jgi:CPA2 family monovalent cation:H+ antiporter-2
VVGSAVVAYFGYRLRLVPIVAFLLTGVAIGPNALGLVNDLEIVNAAAEVGVLLLLFTIGLEFSVSRLKELRRPLFVGGGLQVALATLMTTGILVAAGVDARVALFTGLLVSLSSTAIVLKLLADRGQMGSDHGRLAVSVLLFQDLAVVAMVLLVPTLGESGGSAGELLVALATAAGLIVAVVVLARRVLPPVLERVAATCSPELFLLAVMAICIGTAYGTSLAGVSVSLGAFLAGLVVSESRFNSQALGEVLPLQILFSATFFVSIGMLLDLGFLVTNLPMVLGAVAALLILKALTATAALLALGEKLAVAAAAGLTLAQVGEFSFVLAASGASEGLSPPASARTGRRRSSLPPCCSWPPRHG